jgi:pullulanase/glycogen debranching enzyme
MATAEAISGNIFFQQKLPPQVVAYTINGAGVKDSWKKIYVVLNGSSQSSNIKLPAGTWKIFIADNTVKVSKPVSGTLTVRPSSSWILFQE